MTVWDTIKRETTWVTTCSLILGCITPFLLVGFGVMWVLIFTWIHASAGQISDEIHKHEPGINTAHMFTSDEVKASVKSYGDYMRAYRALGIITIVFATITCISVMVNMSILFIYEIRTIRDKMIDFWKVGKTFRLAIKSTSIITIITTVVLGLLTMSLIVVRILSTVQSSHLHLMVSEWCDTTSSTWDYTKATDTASCGAPSYSDVIPDNWGTDTDCCTEDFDAIHTFCCMFRAPYNWGLTRSSANDKMFENLQQDLLHDLDDANHLTRMEYILQPQFANRLGDSTIWNQNPEGTTLGFFDFTTFSTLIALLVACICASVVTMVFWRIHGQRIAPTWVSAADRADRAAAKAAACAAACAAEEAEEAEESDESENYLGRLRRRDMRF